MSMMDASIETLDEIFRGFEDGSTAQEQVDDDLREAEDTMAQMKIELHTVTNKAKKDEYLLKMQNYNKLIAKYRKTALTQSSASYAGTRPPLSATEKNAQSLEVLKKAHAQLAETEETGINVLSNLAKQKEQIRKVQDNLNQTNEQLGYSNKLLNRMGKWWRG